MKAYVITIRGHEYSERCADRCIASGAAHGVKVEKFDAVTKANVLKVMETRELQWTWPNVAEDVCDRTGLKRHPYKTAEPLARMGCAMSHLLLWEEAANRFEPTLILEHDAVFLRGLPETLPEDFGAIMLNNPEGATPRGKWWRQQIEAKGPGIHRKTHVFPDDRPDGLAGNSAYIISRDTAWACAELYRDLGVWPNDATMCRQLVSGLMEAYPFVTEVQQERSTTGGY